MKKLFTLVALLACFLGAKADEVVDLELDYSTVTSEWVGGWRSDAAATRVKVEDGCLHFHSEEATANFYDVQFQAFGVKQLEYDATYTITLKIKGTVAQDLHASFSGSATPGTIPVTTDWQEVVLEGCQDDPNAQYFASSGQLLIQCGDYVGDWWISYVKITHEAAKETRPVEWRELIVNGDAETAWGELANTKYNDLEETDGRPNTTYVSAWSKEKGVNLDDNGAWNPFPATIEAEAGNESNHVFVVHGKVADTEGDAAAWDNQFWIMSTKELKVGSQYKVYFRYKASEAATTNTQMHSAQPSDYLHYQVLGDVNFSTEWQEYSNTVTIPTPQNNRPIYSIAFNLNPQNKNAIDFYFDDLSIQEMVLDEGFFVASANTTTGIEYDYDNATEFTDAGDGLLMATVGTKGKQDTWVNELQISTLRGHRGSFLGATIKPERTPDGTEEDWMNYVAGSNYKIKLPAAGVWTIYIAPEDMQIVFVQVEGDEITIKEPVDIVTNPTEIVVKGVERDDLADTDTEVREEEGGTGQTWDNQFFIVANRIIAGGTVTVVEFDYVATTEASSPTGTHAQPGEYRKNAFGDVNFKTEEQHFSAEYTIPEADWGGNAITDAQTISFDMAVIKGACDYTIKNVKWYVKDDANANGKTPENLINATGTDNFFVKIGAGNSVVPYGEESAIQSVSKAVNASAAAYNLAGQRVGADYKGMVIKNGKKFMVK